jgi:hypothetical protein
VYQQISFSHFFFWGMEKKKRKRKRKENAPLKL